FCAGGSVTLSAPAAASYLWSSGETTQTIVASVDGPYTVTITDGNGCSATSANMNITVNNLPTVQSIAGNNTVCAGSTTTLTNAVLVLRLHLQTQQLVVPGPLQTVLLQLCQLRVK
ncbi:MAG: hypothetical protein RJB25_501, partial [Bacteroidota bacterium]